MNQTVNALLLAAGFGTRLRPLTLSTPKCLVDIGGVPLLERWLKSLENCNCDNALINTHYLSEQVSDFIKKRRKTAMKIQISHEDQLLGTAGTILANQQFFSEGTSIVIHADNATDFEINDLLKAHYQRPKECCLTMLTFTTDAPSKCGIVETDKDGIVQGFYEKVKHPPGNRANGAVYVFDSEFINTLNCLDHPLTDFSTQVLPELIGRIATYHTYDTFLDIGTPDNLVKAQEHWSLTS